MKLYAVCLNTALDSHPDDFWIEFYWADDQDHAEEQAGEIGAIVCVAIVPSQDGGHLQWRDGVNDTVDPMGPETDKGGLIGQQPY